MKKILVPLADGFEEIEAVALIDILRRSGLETITASIRNLEVTGAHGIPVIADALLKDMDPDEYVMMVIPGGQPGVNNLLSDEEFMKLLNRFNREDKIIGAICAAPVILGKTGILDGKRATCYPGCENQLGGGEFSKEKVVIDGNIMTSRGPATAADFAFAIVERLKGRETADQVKKATLFEK
jgi:4-methyl-5(b-hydroxyethyl)-thiazole monophosphate biosynthesis